MLWEAEVEEAPQAVASSSLGYLQLAAMAATVPRYYSARVTAAQETRILSVLQLSGALSMYE
jgi:hypothetical protein